MIQKRNCRAPASEPAPVRMPDFPLPDSMTAPVPASQMQTAQRRQKPKPAPEEPAAFRRKLRDWMQALAQPPLGFVYQLSRRQRLDWKPKTRHALASEPAAALVAQSHLPAQAARAS